MLIFEKFVHPKNVIDIGCESGTWLAAWKKLFGVEIFGIDKNYVNETWLSIDKKFFHPLNLEKRINLDRHFDIVQSMEVAEHLSPARADSFVEDLTKFGDVILFSAEQITLMNKFNRIGEKIFALRLCCHLLYSS